MAKTSVITCRNYRKAALFAAFLSPILHGNAQADMRGKSLTSNSVSTWSVCNAGRCSRVDPIELNANMYIAKNGKTVYDYEKGNNGVAIPVGRNSITTSDGFTMRARLTRTKLTIYSKNSLGLFTSIFTLAGNNRCKEKRTYKPTQAGIRTKSFRTVTNSCRLKTGNIFSR